MSFDLYCLKVKLLWHHALENFHVEYEKKFWRSMQRQVKHNEITPSHVRITKKASNFTEISAKYK